MSVRRKKLQAEELFEKEKELMEQELSLLRRENALLQQANSAFPTLHREILDTMNVFTGDDLYTINKFIDNFEEASELMGWNALQQFVFSKKLLKGTAAMFLRGEHGLNSWVSLRAALLKEFGECVSISDVHRKLALTKKRGDETFKQYLLRMREIAVVGNIDDMSLIDYVIRGIPDDENNKSVLYGAKSLDEFKDKIDIYSKIKYNCTSFRSKIVREGVTREDKINKPQFKNHNNVDRANVRCYSCGSLGHRSFECKHKERGVRCFNCGRFGHLSSQCEVRRGDFQKIPSERRDSRTIAEDNKISSSVRVCASSDKIPNQIEYESGDINGSIQQENISGVRVKMLDKLFCALIDTGSDVNLITESTLQQLKLPLNKNNIKLKLRCFGGNYVETLGSLNLSVEIQEHNYKSVFHVVKTGSFGRCGVLIGRDLLSQCEVKIINDVVTVCKLKPCREQPCMEVDIFNVEPDEVCLDVGVHKYSGVVEDLKNNYSPKSTRTTNIKCRISLCDDIPVYQRPRRLSILEKKEVELQINEWLAAGIIRRSSSEYASPIVLVKKRDGSLRLCVDYRAINKKIVKDSFPMPLIDDQVDRLAGSSVFSTLDLKNGFFHVPVDEKSVKYTSFVTPCGQYEFLKTPFGLSNSPAVFVRFITEIFQDLVSDGTVLVYFDDLIVPAKDEDEGLKKLRILLRRCEEYGLVINWKKCKFLMKTVSFLGYVISENKISPSIEKTAAVTNFPQPKTIKNVQSFLGLTGYFRKFIKDYALIARPLSNLLKQNAKFKFGDEEINSFNVLKTCLTQKPVLRLYKQEAHTELHTDASVDGYGAVLLQRDNETGELHPIYFMSRKTSDRERKYHSYELEVLAIIEALKRFRVYLLGLKFKIVTDCAAFTMTMGKKDLATRVARWALLLEEFDYIIEHRPGVRMKHCDALSQNPFVLAKENICKIQEEQRRYFNRKRRPPRQYSVGDLVAIKRTQFLPDSKIRRKFLGPYKVVLRKGKDRYEVEKIGSGEGPIKTSSSADQIKMWCPVEEGNSSSETDDGQEGPSCGG